MAKITLKSATFNEHRKAEMPKTLSVFANLPDGGMCFAVVDLRETHGIGEPFLDLIRTQIESFSTRATSEHPQYQFEQLVDSINKAITQGHSEKKWNFAVDRISALLGIAQGENLYLTGVGDLSAMFLHFHDSRYKIYNLFRNLQTESHIPGWEKLFSVVLDGDLHPGDRFFVGNTETLQRLDREDFLSILTTLPPESAVEKLKQYFPFPSDVTMFVLRVDQGEEETTEINSAESSINFLAETRDETTRLLEDQTPTKADWSNTIKQSGNTFSNLGKSVVMVALALLMGIPKGILNTGRSLAKLSPAQFKNRLGGVSKKLLPGGKKRIPSKFGGMRKGMSKQTQMSVAGGIAIVILVLGIGLFVRAKSQKAIQETQAYEFTVSEIRDKLDSAQASLIYKDENEARTLVNEGLGLVETLNLKSTEREEEAAGLKSELENVSNALRKAEPVAALKLLASISVESGATALVQDDETSYALMSDGKVFAYRAGKSAFDILDVTAPENFGEPVRVRYDDLNDVLYVFDGRQIARLDTDQLTYEIVTVTDLNSNTVDFDFFARRVYALSNTDEQIYRHDRAVGGFGAPLRWIEARTVPLNDALSISIDGALWVLKSDGSIVKYSGGTEEAWKNSLPDPALTGSPTLWTTDQVTNLYILDPVEGRIIVIAKDSGLIRKQMTHDAFKKLEGAWEVNGKMRVLTQTGLYEFGL